MRKIIDWIDPYTKESLTKKNEFLISSTNKFPINNNIPNFIKNLENSSQKQVQNSFGKKWSGSKFGFDKTEFEEKIKPVYLEMMGLKQNYENIFNDKLILEIGIGSGSSSKIWAPLAKEFHGIDISEAVYYVNDSLSKTVENPILSQADVNNLPYPDESFDVIVSNGVFHHTPDTKTALKNSLKKLKINGICIFYIYKKKPPIREFVDDYIREKISDLDYVDAWNKIKPFTYLGKSLSEQQVEITISDDIPLLGISKGKYDLQRLIYDCFFKCFWNESWGFEYSNLVNVDWYHPKFSWRHTNEEIINWCNDMNLTINYINEIQSGFACSVTKKSKIF